MINKVNFLFLLYVIIVLICIVLFLSGYFGFKLCFIYCDEFD